MVARAEEDVGEADGEAAQHRLQSLQVVADVAGDDDGIPLESGFRQLLTPARECN